MSRRGFWQDDASATECTKCRTSFGYTVFKHHCRSCGLIYCDTCSASRLLIPEEQLVRRPNNWVKEKLPEGFDDPDSFRIPKRVCDACSHQLRGVQGELRNSLALCNQEGRRDSSDYHVAIPQINYLMQNELANATIMLQRFKSSLGDEEIPKELLDIAKGVAFITIFKVGFMFTGRYGTGFVVTKLDDGTWSAPSAITLSGLGWGFQIGAELTEVMLILSTEAAVETFKSVGQISVGAELSVSVGPLGRSIGSDVSAGDKGAAHAFSYATSKGLFFGASLEASGIAARADVNQKFYGEDVPISSLLSGEYPRPKGAEPLYEALADVMGAPKTSSVSGSYVPGRNSEKNDDDAAVPLDNM